MFHLHCFKYKTWTKAKWPLMRPLTKQSVSRGPLHPAAHSMWQQSLGLVPKQRPLHCGAHTILVTERRERAGWTEVSKLHVCACVVALISSLTDLTLVLVRAPAVISARFVARPWETDKEGIQRQQTTTTKGSQWFSTLTFRPVVLDFDRSVVVPDDVPPVDPRAVPQVLVVDNVDASLQNLCHISVEGKLFIIILETGLVWFVT